MQVFAKENVLCIDRQYKHLWPLPINLFCSPLIVCQWEKLSWMGTCIHLSPLLIFLLTLSRWLEWSRKVPVWLSGFPSCWWSLHRWDSLWFETVLLSLAMMVVLVMPWCWYWLCYQWCYDENVKLNCFPTDVRLVIKTSTIKYIFIVVEYPGRFSQFFCRSKQSYELVYRDIYCENLMNKKSCLKVLSYFRKCENLSW